MLTASSPRAAWISLAAWTVVSMMSSALRILGAYLDHCRLIGVFRFLLYALLRLGITPAVVGNRCANSTYGQSDHTIEYWAGAAGYSC